MIHVDTHADGHVVQVTLDRPERRNAVDVDHCEQLADHVSAATRDGARVVVLAGNGPHFCAGADLTGVEDSAFAGHLRRALDALRDSPAVTMAAVQGAALGAGMQLAVACDLRVAAADARFGIPAGKLGLMVDHWTVQRVALEVGFGPARAVLLAAEELTADDALRLGLAQRAGDIDAALAWAGKIARLAPLSAAGHKLGLNRLEATLDDADYAGAFRRAWSSEDLLEGRAAFAEKRAPLFRGR